MRATRSAPEDGALVQRPAHGNVENVVVAVPVRVVALAEHSAILVVGHRRIVHSVRRREMETTCHSDVRDWHALTVRGSEGESKSLKRNEPRAFARSPLEWNEEGFIKPKRKIEVLTTPSAFPRTGGMTSA